MEATAGMNAVELQLSDHITEPLPASMRPSMWTMSGQGGRAETIDVAVTLAQQQPSFPCIAETRGHHKASREVDAQALLVSPECEGERPRGADGPIIVRSALAEPVAARLVRMQPPRL